MRGLTNYLIVAVLVIGVLFYYFPGPMSDITHSIMGKPVVDDQPSNDPQPIIIDPPTINNSRELTIANWNLQIFGVTKAANESLMNKYADIISDYDIVFVQEIRDSSGTAFPKLCSLLNGYECTTSSRAGRSSSKEQYGVIYKDYITLDSLMDYNPDADDRWERPPIKATFTIGNYSLSVYNIHTKPSDVQMELRYLQNIVDDQGNEMVIGDLNADCNYYDAYYGTEFDSWNWIIKDDEDTTTKTTDCAYDRIILNDDAYQEQKSYGIRTKDIDSSLSDHYLVWDELSI